MGFWKICRPYGVGPNIMLGNLYTKLDRGPTWFKSSTLWNFQSKQNWQANYYAIYPVFIQAQRKLGQWSRDASEVLSGTASLFPADPIVDDIFTNLLAPSRHCGSLGLVTACVEL